MVKLTKIVATISSKKCEDKFLKDLYEAGMNVARLNTAHLDVEEADFLIKKIRKISNSIGIMLDTKGPEVRTGEMQAMEVAVGEKLRIYDKDKKLPEEKSLNVNYTNFSKEVKKGNKILIDDGDVELIVLEGNKGYLTCEVISGEIIGSRKSVNVPNAKLKIPPLSQKDIEFIKYAAENDIEFIAHSFVRNKEDALRVQDILDKYDSKVKIIAKIENQEGVDNIEEILDHVYGIMVARGDLGIEIESHKIPSIQKQLMKKARNARKVVIVATQMLHSMIDNPRPTRAEVSDIANAIYDGTDAVMLSGETAFGKYPVEAVKIMTETAKTVESCSAVSSQVDKLILTNPVSNFLMRSTIQASADLPISAIVADSFSGRTIRGLSAYRPRQPIFAMCYDVRTMRELSLSYGVIAEYMPARDTTDEFLCEALIRLQKQAKITEENLILVIAGNFGTKNGASFIEVSEMGMLLARQRHFLNENKKKANCTSGCAE